MRDASDRVEPPDDLGGDLGIDFKADDEPTVPRRARMRPRARTQASRDDVAVATADDEGDDSISRIWSSNHGAQRRRRRSRAPRAKGVATTRSTF